MLILLKMTCFGLWLYMMLVLLLAMKTELPEPIQERVIALHHPSNAENTIRDQLRRLTPEARLCIEILATNHSEIEELTHMIECFQRKNPSIIIGAYTGLTPNNI